MRWSNPGYFACAVIIACLPLTVFTASAEDTDVSDLFESAKFVIPCVSLSAKVTATKDKRINYDLKGHCDMTIGSAVVTLQIKATGVWKPDGPDKQSGKASERFTIPSSKLKVDSEVACLNNPWTVPQTCAFGPKDSGMELPPLPISASLLSPAFRNALIKLTSEALLKPVSGFVPDPPPPPTGPVGCKNFLGNSTQQICTTDSGFSECLVLKKQGKILMCIRSSAPVDQRLFGAGCKTLVTVAGNWLCTYEIGYLMCEKARQKGEAKVCAWAGHPETALPGLCAQSAKKGEWSCPTSLGMGFCKSAMKKGTAAKCAKG